MKKLLILLSLITSLAKSEDITLTLTWIQPPGYQSTLYCSTNLGSAWSSFGIVNPPVLTHPTNQVAFFYVNVVPTNVTGFVIYTTNPNDEGLKPLYANSPSMAYTDDGAGTLYVWSITDQSWK